MNTRVTRQAAVGRFRKERVERREKDLRERQALLIKVAERLLVVMQETHSFLSDVEDKRLLQRKRIREELSKFRLNLSEETVSSLVQFRDERLQQAEVDRDTRAENLAKLREDVVQIVSEDFSVA